MRFNDEKCFMSFGWIMKNKRKLRRSIGTGKGENTWKCIQIVLHNFPIILVANLLDLIEQWGSRADNIKYNKRVAGKRVKALSRPGAESRSFNDDSTDGRTRRLTSTLDVRKPCAWPLPSPSTKRFSEFMGKDTPRMSWLQSGKSHQSCQTKNMIARGARFLS